MADQVFVQDINTRVNRSQLIRNLRSLKGLLKREVNYCTQKVDYFCTLMAATQPQTQMMIEYASEILDNYARCQVKNEEVKNGFWTW